MTKILVTGANGYIGRNLTRHLAKNGHAVTALMRHANGDIGPQHANINTVQVPDLADIKGTLLSEHAVVIHTAGRAHLRGQKGADQAKLYQKDNVDLAVTLAKRAYNEGCRQFIFLSSIGAALLEDAIANHTSTLEQVWQSNPYRASKLAAEQALECVRQQSPAFDILSLRLPMVYGKDAPGNFKTLCKAIQKRVPLPFGSIQNKRVFVSIETLCAFVTHSLTQPPKSGVYAIRDADEVSTPDFIRGIAAAGGYPSPLLFPFPLWPMRLCGSMIGMGQTVESLLDSLHVDLEPLATAYAWRPDKGTQDALRHSFMQEVNNSLQS